MQIILGGVAAVIVTAAAVTLRRFFRPPQLTGMSHEWIQHTRYQLTKDGGPRSIYGTVD